MGENILDTYRAVKTLKAAGVGESQAEAIVNKTDDGIGENLATRNDLNILEQRLTICLGGLMIGRRWFGNRYGQGA